MSFARNVRFTIKSGQVGDFNRLMNTEVLPMLKKEKGFRQDLTVVEEHAGMSISVWDDRAAADAYNTMTYPEVLKKLTPVLDGTPDVETYDTIYTISQ